MISIAYSSLNSLKDDDFYDFEEYEAQEEFKEINDPIEPWNRMVFKFNDTFYSLLFKPASTFRNAKTS